MNNFPSQRRKCLSLESFLGPSFFWGNSPHLQTVVDRIDLHLATFHLRTSTRWNQWFKVWEAIPNLNHQRFEPEMNEFPPTPKWRLGKFHLKQRTQTPGTMTLGLWDGTWFSFFVRECISKMPDNFIGVVYFILRQSLALHEILQNVSWWLFLAPNLGRFFVSPHHWIEVKNYRMSSNHKVLTNQGFEQNTSKNKNFQGRRKTAAGRKNKP